MNVLTRIEPDAQAGAMLESALNGDREALGRLLSRYSGQLYQIAFRVLGSREDAEDALQDGLLAAVRNLDSFEGRSKFSTWLVRIITNSALMVMRKNRAHALVSLEDASRNPEDLPLASRLPDLGPNPEEVCERRERRRMLQQSLHALSADYFSAVWLRDVQGLSTEEAARILGLSIGTLKSRLHRARTLVSKNLGRAQRLRAHRGCANSRF
jgi:RNA polymerase sigma-70 factor, ECF subfamily